MNIQLGNENELRYMQIYNHYKHLILTAQLTAGAKLPSIRRTATELSVSRTTVETAYMLLSADGYIISKPQSGFYVTDLDFLKLNQNKRESEKQNKNKKIDYDFVSANADKESFDFNLWRRYIKSALRQDERLLSYGEPQGERELRNALAKYISEKRNVVCSEDNIIVGAGIQSLLHIICVLVNKNKRVSFPNNKFKQAIAVFEDYNWEIEYGNYASPVIYTTPSHITNWGNVMNLNERLDLIKHANENDSLIIEDDYDNEFCYFNRPAPSLQSLAGGHNVIYMGTFSRLLLPSIRISFMVLPPELIQTYYEIEKKYNQTASKTEQIALCQFIRDGHLSAQTRKLKKLYNAKSKKLADEIKLVFKDLVNITQTESGMHIKVTFNININPNELIIQSEKRGILLNASIDNDGKTFVILSCTSVATSQFGKAVSNLHTAINSSYTYPNLKY